MNEQPKNKKRVPIFLYYIIIIAIVVILVTALTRGVNKPTSESISYDRFIAMVNGTDTSLGKIVQITMDKETNKIEIKTDTFETTHILYITGVITNDGFEKLLGDHNAQVQNEEDKITYECNEFESASFWDYFLAYGLPLIGSGVLFFIFFRLISRRMGDGVMSFGKNTSKIYAEKQTGKTFADVAGQDEAKQSLKEILDFLNNPQKYTEIGAKLPKGALLVGPPGTGKTLLAKAVAGEAGVPFFSLSGSEFVEMFVGAGAARVRDLFKQAVANAPCIVFIDEIDAIGKSREGSITSNDEREQTLNQLLSEMDGFNSSKGVVILAATNRPEVLDKALLRPGRFDRRIIVDLPDQEGRVAILKVHAKNVHLDNNVDFEIIARATAGASGAELENIINEAALRAVRAGKTQVSQHELDEAVEVILAGEAKKNKIMSDDEKKIVAYHETGHALITALITKAEPVHKITIIPRTSGALGYVMHVAKKEKVLYTKEELQNEIVILTGGRAAEQVEFGNFTTGAANDIEKATQMARAMITQYGMCGTFGFVNWEKKNSMYLLDSTTSNCSDETAREIDQEIIRVTNDCYNKAIDLLSGHKATLDSIAAVLFEKETITGEAFIELLKQYEPTIASEIEASQSADKPSKKSKDSSNNTEHDNSVASSESKEQNENE